MKHLKYFESLNNKKPDKFKEKYTNYKNLLEVVGKFVEIIKFVTVSVVCDIWYDDNFMISYSDDLSNDREIELSKNEYSELLKYLKLNNINQTIRKIQNELSKIVNVTTDFMVYSNIIDDYNDVIDIWYDEYETFCVLYQVPNCGGEMSYDFDDEKYNDLLSFYTNEEQYKNSKKYNL